MRHGLKTYTGLTTKHVLSGVQGLNEEVSFVSNYIDEFLYTDQETDTVAEVLNSVRSSRGKMVRPQLLLLASRFGPDYTDRRQHLCKLGAFVEIVHMASLIHDDIIDDSPLRRSRPTVQQQYGKDMAVFTGDFLISRVLRHLAEEGMTQEAVSIGQTIEEMCRGELMQKSCRWDTQTSIDAYLRNIYSKSVALIMVSAQLGAVGSNSSEQTITCLTEIGEHLGYMYQVRDDLLDFVSDQRQEGKPVYRDFADGIYTLPVLYALKQPQSAARLKEIAAADINSPGYVELMQEMREIVRQSGGIAFGWQQIESHAAEAKRKLQSLPEHEAGLGIDHIIDKLLGNNHKQA